MANPLRRAAQLMVAREAKSVTTSQLLPVHQADTPQFRDWSTRNAIKEGYKVSVWVYTAISLKAKAVASVPWFVRKIKSDGTWEPDYTHPLSRLLKRPNEFMSRRDMMERLVAHLELGGNGLWTKLRVGKMVVELWPIDPTGVRPVPSPAKFISRYEYDLDGVKKDLDPADVLHLMYPDPANPYWGLSPLQAAARVVDTDVEAVKWNKVSLQNRAQASGVLSFKHPLDPDQWDEAREQVRRQIQGPENARGILVMGASADWKQMSLTPIEMDFIKSRQFSREEILSVFHVPPTMAGIGDNAALSNVLTWRRIFWSDTIVPLLEDIRAGMNRALVPEFGDPEKIDLMYDVTNVEALQDDFHKKIETAEHMFRMGIPVNVIIDRLELDIDALPGGDQGFIPGTMVPLSIAGALEGE